MMRVINSGQRGDFEAMDFAHNIRIDGIFQRARNKAWASIMDDPRITALKKKQQEIKALRYRKKRETQKLQPILNMYK